MAKPDKDYHVIEGKPLPRVTSILDVISKPAFTWWAAKEERELLLTAASSVYEGHHLNKLAVPSRRREWPSPLAFRQELVDRLGAERGFQKASRKALDIGSQAHARIEWEVKRQLRQAGGPEPVLRDEALLAYMSYEDWAKSVRFKPRESETLVWYEEEGYAGHLDIVGEVEETLIQVSIKTGKAIYLEAKLQEVAYWYAQVSHHWAESSLGTAEAVDAQRAATPKRIIILRLPKTLEDPEFEVQEVPQEKWHYYFEMFLAAKLLWERAKNE